MDILSIKGMIAAVAGMILAFIMPISHFILVMLALVIADWITGTRAAKKAGEKISPDGLRRTSEKSFFYFIYILLAQGVENVFLNDIMLINRSLDFPLTYLVSSYIAYTEFFSVTKNVEKITGMKIMPYLKKKFKSIFPTA